MSCVKHNFTCIEHIVENGWTKKPKKVCHFDKHILSIVTRMSISVNALIISSFKLREENGNLEMMFILTMKLLDNRAVGLWRMKNCQTSGLISKET